MEANKCLPTSSVATENNQLIIDDLDDDSLGMIFNKLPYIDRMRIGSVCKRWYAVSEANWSTYSKRLRIGEDTGDFLPSYDHTTEKKNILEMILQRLGPYLEEITFKRSLSFFYKFKMGTIKWIAEVCPKLKRLDTGLIVLNEDDWSACSNLEELSFTSADGLCNGDGLSILFRCNKRLRRLEIIDMSRLKASDFDELDPGQLEFLRIEFCRDFQLTAKLVDKLAESLVELSYITNSYLSLPNLQHLGKLKNLRSLDLTVCTDCLEGEYTFIANIAENCRKLEWFNLAILAKHAHVQNDIALLFDLPHLIRLVIIVTRSAMSCQEREKLLQRQRPSHLQFFVIRI